jgi:hypothetical protein
MLGMLALAACPAGSAARSQPSATPTAPPTDAIPDQLTVEQAVQIGLERNPQIAAGSAGLASAAANYRSLAAFPNLTLAVSHVNGTSAAPTLNGTTNDTFLDFGETLDTSGQRHFQLASLLAIVKQLTW